jgi:hypothetical protein
MHHDDAEHIFLGDTFALTGFTDEEDGFNLIYANGLAGTIIQAVENFGRALQQSISGVLKTRYKLEYTVAVGTAPDGDFALTLKADDEAGAGIAAEDVDLPVTAGTHEVYFYSDVITNDLLIAATHSTSTEGDITISDIQISGVAWSPISIAAGDTIDIDIPDNAVQINFINPGNDIKILDADDIPVSLADQVMRGCASGETITLKNSGASAETVEFWFDLV